MKIVYILQSLSHPARHYTGITDDIDERLRRHNEGRCPHTSKHVPWHLLAAITFTEEPKARAFERYLKSGSGRAFSKRHF